MSTITVHNMDCMPSDTLIEIAEEERTRRTTQVLTVQDAQISHLVEIYGRTKFLAMWHRATDKITEALKLEQACEAIYECFPEEHRW